MLGTYLLVFLGPSSIVAASLLGLTSIEALLLVAAVFGTTVASVIMGLGRFSGAHINPAISVGSAVAGLLKRELFLPYVLFQVAGGLLAGLSLKIAFGALSGTNLGSTELAQGITPAEGIALEIVGTFVLALYALSAASFVKSPLKQALLVGGTLFVLILFIGPLTGASFNPARSLGPSLFSGYLGGGQLLYFVGPVVGAACAGLIFGALRKSHGKIDNKKKLNLVCVC
jgi:glycerol uptake facilitator-like aquaporin